MKPLSLEESAENKNREGGITADIIIKDSY